MVGFVFLTFWLLCSPPPPPPPSLSLYPACATVRELLNPSDVGMRATTQRLCCQCAKSRDCVRRVDADGAEYETYHTSARTHEDPMQPLNIAPLSHVRVATAGENPELHAPACRHHALRQVPAPLLRARPQVRSSVLPFRKVLHSLSGLADLPACIIVSCSKSFAVLYARRTEYMPAPPREVKYHPSSVDLIVLKKLTKYVWLAMDCLSFVPSPSPPPYLGRWGPLVVSHTMAGHVFAARRLSSDGLSRRR